MYDVIIVGGGPAGLSAALVLGRCRRKVVVLDAGEPRNRFSTGLHGYLGHDCVNPGELLEEGRREIAAYGVEFRRARVAEARCDDHGATVTLDDGSELKSRKLLLATGLRDHWPQIPGADPMFGKSIHHCPYCDGWEWRDAPLAAYGHDHRAAKLALELLGWSRDVVVIIDGHELDAEHREKLAAQGIGLRTERVVCVEGEGDRLQRIVFEQGEPVERSAMFFALGQEPASLLAEQLGCDLTPSRDVDTDWRERTNVPNVWVVGDASKDMKLAIVAAAEGAKAAVSIHIELGKA
jgi:thioredoxin reductase